MSFGEKVEQLQAMLDEYDEKDQTVDELIDNVKTWLTVVRPKNMQYPITYEAELKAEWDRHHDVQIFRLFNEKGMSYRAMGRVCGVSAAAISRWLSGDRTMRSTP